MTRHERRFRRALGQWVRARREELLMSQADVAWRAGLHVTAIAHIENGRRLPGTYTLLRVARALHTGLDDLFTLDGAP